MTLHEIADVLYRHGEHEAYASLMAHIKRETNDHWVQRNDQGSYNVFSPFDDGATLIGTYETYGLAYQALGYHEAIETIACG